MRRISGIVCLSSFAVLLTLLAAPAVSRAQDLYRVRMSAPGAMGIVTDCSAEGYMLALPESGGKILHSTGSELDADGSPGPDLFLDLVTDVAWSRTYDVGRGLSGVFNGCYGETFGTNSHSGTLYIFFEINKGTPTVRFTWHFDYYVTPGNTSREHFSLRSGKIPFAAWAGEDLSSRVSGPFVIEHYHKEGRTIQGETLASGLMLEFDLSIEKVQ